jgi:hypothetical protein
VRRNFFSNRVVDSWNQIPSEMKNARNVGMFKRLYRIHREARPIQPKWRKEWSYKMEVWRASGHKHCLRGHTGATGSSSTRKQVSNVLTFFVNAKKVFFKVSAEV